MTQTSILLFTLVAMCAPGIGYGLGWLADPKRVVWKVLMVLYAAWWMCRHLDAALIELCRYTACEPSRRAD